MNSNAESSSAPVKEPDFHAGIAWNVASLFVLAVAGIALNALIARLYGSAMLGVFNQVLCAYILFSMAAAGGINYSLLASIAESPRDSARVASAVVGALLPTIILATIVTALFYGSRHWIADRLQSEGIAIGMRAATPGLFFFALNKQLLAVVNGLRRMRAFAIYQALRYVLILGGFVIGWQTALAGEQLSFVWSFAEGILFVVLAIEVGIQVAWRSATNIMHWSRTHLIFGSKSVVSAMLLELNAKVDIWMLGLWLDDASVGVYSFAANLAEGFYQLIIVLQNNFNPLMANLIARGERIELEAMISKSRRWIVPAFAATALAAALIYPWTMPLLKGPEFADSGVSFAILVGAIGALAAWLPFGNLLLMAKHPAWNSLLMALVVGVNVAVNALLIPKLGIAGAAVGTATAFVAFALLLKLFVRRLIGVRL